MYSNNYSKETLKDCIYSDLSNEQAGKMYEVELANTYNVDVHSIYDKLTQHTINNFYACLQTYSGQIERVGFDDRSDARKYITDNFDPAIHASCWTE